MRTTKLTKVGNSTGLTLSRDVLAAAHLDRGDEVTVNVCDGRIEIARADDGYNKAMEMGRSFSVRYRRAMAALAK
ncbi:AbrB family transcriptional regulator [Magnetospirillum sp. 15-1]|uniref:AbrB/MazE/SpoVT family DNA-binding domain-containing protein n=1 Tax=Magnetospirillum sp. 15-1 TaxID=1979370 RepID=UPI000BBCDF1D|nr:AbrB family transcriptional regulator [Magnetospirillum sp. 15-1]